MSVQPSVCRSVPSQFPDDNLRIDQCKFLKLCTVVQYHEIQVKFNFQQNLKCIVFEFGCFQHFAIPLFSTSHGGLSLNIPLMSYFLLQVRLQIKDGGSPPRSSVSTLQIFVNRNMLPPSFLRNFNVSILENSPVGVVITSVKAEDQDPQVTYVNLPNKKSNACGSPSQ